MKKMRDIRTGEISYFDEQELVRAKRTRTKVIEKYKRCNETAVVADLRPSER